MTLGYETLGFQNTPNDLSVKGKYLFYPFVFSILQLLTQSVFAWWNGVIASCNKNGLIISFNSSPGHYGSNDPAPIALN